MSGLSSPARTGARDHLFGAFLAVGYVVLLLATSGGLGMSRDESFYVTAAERYGNWYRLLIDDPSTAVQKPAIDKLWAYNNEHPSLMKTVFAFTWLLDTKGFPALRTRLGLTPSTLFTEPSMAYRFGGMLSAGLTLWLLYIFGARAADRRIGAFAALSFASMPRIFYNSHLDCFDIPIVLMLTWTVYCYWRSLASPRWAVMTGIAYGCSLATKHNAWILPGILLVHFGWVAMDELSRRKRGKRARVVLTPYFLLAMLTLGPLLFVGSWPWLWYDTWPRFVAYANFHLHHVYYNIEYLGVNYFRPPFPISVPFVLTLFTLPLTTVLLCLAGLVVRARAFVPRVVAQKFLPRMPLQADARATDVLWLGCMLAPMIVIALPSTPIFGGTKHWFPAYPFLALFAGRAALYVIVSAESRLLSRGLRNAALVPVASMALLLAPGVAETAHSHRFALSHYTLAAGGVPGAADWGMNRQYWGFTTGSVVGFLREKLPKGGSVFLHDTTPLAFEMLKRDGYLPPNIRGASSLSEADYVLVHHEKHMVEVDFQAWQAFGSVQPVHVLTYDGVPIITIYEHPRRRVAPVR